MSLIKTFSDPLTSIFTQDLLDKQMEVLSNKYGGSNTANSAANTIQRAYRRYTMDKKFKAITSNRLSRRFASMSGGGGAQDGGRMQDAVNDSTDGTQQNFHHDCCVYSSTAKSSYAGTVYLHHTLYSVLPTKYECTVSNNIVHVQCCKILYNVVHYC